jgi:DnaJ-class molecular chaperone
VNKSEKAIEIFKQITTAYDTLSNSQEREKYDILKGIFKTEKTTTSPKRAQEEYNTSSSTFENNYSSNVNSTSSNFQKKPNTQKKQKNSLVKAIKLFFTKLKKRKRTYDNKKPQKGDNITTEVTISPEEVIVGSKRVINVLTTQTCPKCLGHRFVNGGKCFHCGGRGEVSTRKKITVTIPKGIKNGAKLRLKGEGGAGKNGGANGDLYINIKIENLTNVHYDKLNVYYNVPVTPFEAALGEEIKVPTFDGVIKLKLPKNTCSGQKFRISKQGIKKHGKIGDLIITVSIEFSHDLSDDEIKLYEKLKNLSKDDIRKNLINEN